jgi:serine protease Do
MKPSVTPWLVIALVLSLNAGTKAQLASGGGVGLTNPQTDANQKPTKGPDQAGIQRVLVQELANQIQGTVSGLPEFRWIKPNDTIFQFSNQSAELSLTPADDALRAHLGLPKDQGLIVTAVAGNASAAQAGVQQNDILLKLENAALAKPEDLENGLKAAGGNPASLTVLRGGETMVIRVQPQVHVTMGPVQPEPPAFWIGISVAPVEPALRAQLKLSQQGLLAVDVIKDSPAAKADIKVHDILLSLAEKPLDSQEKLIEIVQSNGEKSVPMQLIRAGKVQTIEVTPQRRKPTPLKNASIGGSTISYQVVGPGGIVSTNGNWIVDVTSPNKNQFWSPGAGDTLPMNVTASSKRLEEIDAEIKQLRKAIEELSKTLKDKK